MENRFVILAFWRGCWLVSYIRKKAIFESLNLFCLLNFAHCVVQGLSRTSIGSEGFLKCS